MPTKTFINLPKEKKIRILKAAKKEFSRVPLEKAVIANIVKEADIPRGSFYQYFESINDLFVYLINYNYGIDKKKFVKYLEETDNDFYKALKIKFSNEIDRLAIAENRQFKKNIITTIMSDSVPNKEYVLNSIKKLDGSIDPNVLPQEIKKAKNSNKIIDLIKMIGRNCIEAFINDTVNAIEVKEDYNNYIDFVKTDMIKD